jgi:hypothetical protein
VKYLLLVVAILATGTVAKADNVSASVGIADRSMVSYSVELQKNLGLTYVSLGNEVAGNASSNTTTAAFGLNIGGLNVGAFGGDRFVTGKLYGVFGAEVSGQLAISGPFFLKDSVRIGRETGSDLTSASLSAGIGLSL